MGYPLATVDGTPTSWGNTGTFYPNLMAKLTQRSATIAITGDDPEVSALGADVLAYIPGMREWEANITGFVFATPRLGNVGTITVNSGSGYTTHLKSWTMKLETPAVHDITAPGSQWRSKRPDRIGWSGNFVVRHDSSTLPVLPLLPPTGASAATLANMTFTYGKDATDDKLTGDVILTNLTVTQPESGIVELNYTFKGSGALTAAGTNSLFTAGTLGVFPWDQMGATTDYLLTVTAISGKTWSGSAFAKAITIDVNTDGPVAVSIGAQGTGALTGPS